MKKQIFISLLTFFLILNLPIIAKSQCILLDALTGDTSDFGNPGSPVPGLPKDPHPQEFLSFDDENYYVYGTNLHNREVRLAISKEITQLDEFLRTNYAQFIFNVWSYYWKIFQGFSYDSYTVLVSDTPSTNPGGWGLGFEWELSDAMDTCFMSRCEAYSCLAHEIFHAWNPNSLDTNRMQGWFTEGGTVYYTNRAHALFIKNVRNLIDIQRDFDQLNRNALHRYLYEIKGTVRDVPLTEAGQLYWSTDRWVFAVKGLLVTYLFDKSLNEAGSNLDNLLKYMYKKFNYGLGTYTTNDMKEAAETITGNDYDQFFNDYILGTTPLPFDENSIFEFFVNNTSPDLINDINPPQPNKIYRLPWLPLLLLDN